MIKYPLIYRARRRIYQRSCKVQLSERVLDVEGRPVCMVVDEAQEFFDKPDMGKKLYLSYHRHIGQEIRLIAHKDTDIHHEFRSYIEKEYRAKFTSIFKLPYIFLYQHLAAGESLGYTISRKDQAVFFCYKSFGAGGKKTKSSPALFIILVIMAFIVWWFMRSPQRVFSRPSGAHKDIFGSEIVLENVKTGIQRRLPEVDRTLKVVKAERSDYCVLANLAGREVTIYNQGSRSDRIEQPLSPPALTSAASAPGGLKMDYVKQ